MTTWGVQDQDLDFFDRELQSFVPDRVYDVHAHLYRERHWRGNAPVQVQIGPSDVTLETYLDHMEWILPGREVHALCFPFPPEHQDFDAAAANEWVSRQIAKDPLARGQFLLRPTDDPEWVRQEVNRLGLRGLKPFAALSRHEDYNEAEIPDYLPEPIVAVAHEEGWSITLHLVRPSGVSDASNIHWIRTYCERYPHMQLILDHVARGFNPYHAVRGLEQLTGLDNLWVDTSVNCSPLATIAALRHLGPNRVLFASDFFCSHIRGAIVTVNDTFLWLGEHLPIWDDSPGAGGAAPTLLGLESLRAVKAAFQTLKLGDREVEKYFWGNAAELLGLPPRASN